MARGILLVVIYVADLPVCGDQPSSIEEAIVVVKKLGADAKYNQSLIVEIPSGDIESDDALARSSKEEVSAAVRALGNLHGIPIVLDLKGERIDDSIFGALSSIETVVKLRMWGVSVTDVGLSKIGNLKLLEELEITNASSIVGNGLESLPTLRRLKRLVLWGTPISDEAMAFIGGAGSLSFVEISGSEISDAGLAQLGGLRKLSHLVIEQNNDIRGDGFRQFPADSLIASLQINEPITNLGFANACKFRNIRRLSICNSMVDNEGLSPISNLRKLDNLVLIDNASLSDSAIIHLKGLSNLQYLELSQDRMTDRVLEHIDGFDKLTELRLRDMPVSDESIKRFLDDHNTVVEKVLAP